MKYLPVFIAPKFLCYFFFAFVLVISCSKDNDMFEGTVLNEAYTAVEEIALETNEEEVSSEEITELEIEEETVIAIVENTFETRTTTFPAINDAHIQGNSGYNQNIVRLAEGQRTSYLMFDLSPIDSIGGTVSATNLHITIQSDNGNGNISVFKSISNDWSEKELSAKNAPQTDALAGELATQFEIGQNHEIALDTTLVHAEILTLILVHENGNDLAFASKEHSSGNGPTLMVTYSVPQNAEAIVFNDDQEIDFQAHDSSGTSGEVTLDENVVNVEVAEEQATDEASQAEAAIIKEPTETVEEKTRIEETNNEPDAPTNESPIAIAEASPSNGDAPLKVKFKGDTSSDDLGVKKYVWDFRDGSTSTEKNPTHTFEKTGTLEVRLTVTDDHGASNTDTVTITINEKEDENKAPKAVAEGTPLTGDAPLKINLKADNSTDDKSITGYFWDFKDGSTTTSKNPSHTFSEPGEYEVELSVKDAEGLTDATTIKVTVNQRPSDNGGGSSSGSVSSSGSGSGSSSGSGSTTSSTGNYPSNAVMASSFGFKAGDATAAFEAAIKSGKSYVVIDKQSSDWVIQPTRFFDLRNMTIVFEPGVTLRAKSGAFKEGHRLFQLTRAKNVTIEGNGATFKMNKNEYTSGEQRHAFEMTMCSDITVRGLTLRDSGGAGMKISGDDNNGYSQNITLENITALNNRRDGITINSAQNVWVRNSEFSGSKGTRPEAGVVLETDRPSQRLANINFINCKMSDNESAGFHFTASQMNGSSMPVSIKVIDSDFSNNAISPPSGFLATEVEIGGGSGTNVVGGEVRFERVKFNGSRGRIVFTRKSANGFKAVFKDCEARNVISATSASPIAIEAHSSRSTMGGMVFDNFYIQYNKNVPFMYMAAPSQNGSFKIKDVTGSFTIKEPGDNPLDYNGSYRADKNVNVSINYKHI